MNEYVAYISARSISDTFLPAWVITVHELDFPDVLFASGQMDTNDLTTLYEWFCARGLEVVREILPGMAYTLSR